MQLDSVAPTAVARPRARSPVPRKKTVIKPFRVAPKPPDAFAQESLDHLTAAVDAVYNHTHSQFSQEELYRVKSTKGRDAQRKHALALSMSH